MNCKFSGIVRAGVSVNDYAYYAINFQEQACDSIVIDRCSGSEINSHQARTEGIWLRFTNHWKVSNTRLQNYYDGLTWWGGDSFPANEGAVENERKCANGIVDHVHVEDVFASGIWGSMGTNILVTNSYVNNAGDLGINFEGCTNSRATGDTSRNSPNGALSAYFFSDGITFDHNTVEVDNNVQFRLMEINLAGFNKGSKNITFTNNVFRSLNGVAQLVEEGPVDNLVFSNNVLENAVLYFTADRDQQPNDRIEISNNDLSFTLVVPTTYLADGNFPINAGRNTAGSQLIIQNNTIRSSAPQPGAAIRISQGVFKTADPNDQDDRQITSGNVISTVAGNFVTGFQTYALVTWGTFGVTSTVNILSSPSGPPTSIDQIARDGDGNQSASFINLDGQPL